MKDKREINLIALLLVGVLILSNVVIAEDAAGTTTGTGSEVPALASGVKLPDGWIMNGERELLFKGDKVVKVPEGMQIKSLSDGNIQFTGKNTDKIIINGVGAKKIKSLKGANGDVTWYNKGIANNIKGVKNIELEFNNGQPSRIKLDKDSGNAILSDLNGKHLAASFSNGGKIEVTSAGVVTEKTEGLTFTESKNGKDSSYTINSNGPSGKPISQNGGDFEVKKDANGETQVKMSFGEISREGSLKVLVPKGGEFTLKSEFPKSPAEISSTKSGLWFEEGKGIEMKGNNFQMSGSMNGDKVGLKLDGSSSIGKFDIGAGRVSVSEGEITKISQNPANLNEQIPFSLKSNKGSAINFEPKYNDVRATGDVILKQKDISIQFDENGRPTMFKGGNSAGSTVEDLNKLLIDGKSQEFYMQHEGVDGSFSKMKYGDPFVSNQNNQVELADSKNQKFQFSRAGPSQQEPQIPENLEQKAKLPQTASNPQSPKPNLPETNPPTQFKDPTQLAKEKEVDPTLYPELANDRKKAAEQAAAQGLGEDQNQPSGYTSSVKYAEIPSDGPVWPTESGSESDKPGKVVLADGLSQERIAGIGGEANLPNGDLKVEGTGGGSGNSGGNGQGTPTEGAGTPKPGEGRYPGPQLTKYDGVTTRVDGIGKYGRARDNYRVLGYSKEGKDLYVVMENLNRKDENGDNIKLQINAKEVAEEWGNKMFRAADYYKSSDIPSKLPLSPTRFDGQGKGFTSINTVMDTTGIQKVSFNDPIPVITDASTQQVADAKDIYFKPSVSSEGKVSLIQDDGSAKNAVKYKVTSDGKIIDPTNEKFVGSTALGEAKLDIPISMKVEGSGEFAGKRIVAFQGKNYIVDGGVVGAKEVTDFQLSATDALMKNKEVPAVPSTWQEYTPKNSGKEFTISATKNEVIVSGKDYISKQVFESPQKALEEKQRLTRGGISLKDIQESYPNVADAAERTKIDATLKAAAKQNGDNLANIQKFKDKYPADLYTQKALETQAQKQLGISYAEANAEYARLLEQKSQSYSYLGQNKNGDTIYGSSDGKNWERITDGKQVAANGIPYKEEDFSTLETPTKTQTALDKVRQAKEIAMQQVWDEYQARTTVKAGSTSTPLVSTPSTSTPETIPTSAATVKISATAETTSGTKATASVSAPKGYSGDWPPKLKSVMEKPASMSDSAYRKYINDNPVPGMADKWDSMGYGEKRFQTGKYLMSERAKVEGIIKQYSTSDLQISYQNIPATKADSRADLGNNVYYTRFVDKGTKLKDGSKSTSAVRYYYDTKANLIGFYKFPTSNKDKKAGYYKL